MPSVEGRSVKLEFLTLSLAKLRHGGEEGGELESFLGTSAILNHKYVLRK